MDTREFSFTYTFSPHSEQEAITLEEICKFFRKYALPSKNAAVDYIFDFPCQFSIEFVDVRGYPKIGPCVCTAEVKSPTSGALAIYKSGHPVQTAISLTFKEIDVLTEEEPGV
jgi:hypothetical protein